MIKKILFFGVIIFLAFNFLNSRGGDKIRSFWSGVDFSRDGYYSFKSLTLTRMAKSKGEKGEIEKSKELFNLSKEAAGKITDGGKRAEKIMEIAETRAATDKTAMRKEIIEETRQAIKEVSKSGKDIPNETKSDIFKRAAQIQLTIDEPEMLKEPEKEIISLEDASMFLFNVSKVYLENGEIDQAKEAIEKISDKYYKAAAIISITRFILDGEDKEGAENYANNFDDVFFRKAALLEIISFHIKNGDIESAVKALKELEKEL